MKQIPFYQIFIGDGLAPLLESVIDQLPAVAFFNDGPVDLKWIIFKFDIRGFMLSKLGNLPAIAGYTAFR